MRWLFAAIAISNFHTYAFAWQRRDHAGIDQRVEKIVISQYGSATSTLVSSTPNPEALAIADLKKPIVIWPCLILSLVACAAGGACGAGTLWLHSKRQASEAATDDRAATGEESRPKRSKSEDALQTIEEYDKLLRTLATEAVHRVGPTLARGHALRGVVEKRAAALAKQAKFCFLNELNNAAGDFCEAVDAPEAMLLFDLEGAVESHFPSWSVLLAGLMAPLVLHLTLRGHILQICLMLLPIAIMCSASLFLDFHHSCSVIPSLWAWLVVQTLLAFVLIVVRLMLSVETHRGQKLLGARIKAEQEKQDRLLQRKQGTTGGLKGLRELFVSKAGLLQHALVIEHDLRRSSLRHVVGSGTVLWLLVTVWGWVLIVGWTFMPGVVYFSRKPSPGHCSTLVTVFTLKASCAIMILGILSNIGTVLHWIADLLVEDERFSSFVMRYAADTDQIFLGLPITQILAKAFVLRGSADLTFSRLSIAVSEKARLAEELVLAKSHLEQVQQQLNMQQATVDELKGKTESSLVENPDLNIRLAEMERSLNQSLDVENWRQKGEAAIQHARTGEQAFQQSSVADLDLMAKRLTHAVESLLQQVGTLSSTSDDEASQSSNLESLRKRGEEALQSAGLQAEDLEALRKRGQEALQTAGQKAKQAVEQTTSRDLGSMAQQLAQAAALFSQAAAASSTASASEEAAVITPPQATPRVAAPYSPSGTAKPTPRDAAPDSPEAIQRMETQSTFSRLESTAVVDASDNTEGAVDDTEGAVDATAVLDAFAAGAQDAPTTAVEASATAVSEAPAAASGNAPTTSAREETAGAPEPLQEI
mmetsp:Transcript_6719/g.11559  ORF Transcript_6719/g.11559 Transcript_6719/m.11559 type:complete len:820 (-) Transcript_6719:100-2559(-)